MKNIKDELEILESTKRCAIGFIVLVLGFLAIFVFASIGWSGETSSNVKAVLSALSLFGTIAELFWVCAYNGKFAMAVSQADDLENPDEALKRAKIATNKLNNLDHSFTILALTFFVIAAALISL